MAEFQKQEINEIEISEKENKKLKKIKQARLLNLYIKIHKFYANKHKNKMDEIDSILNNAPCKQCHTYKEADKLTDKSFEEYNKYKKHERKYKTALNYIK